MLKEFHQEVLKCPVLMTEMTIWMHFFHRFEVYADSQRWKKVNGQYICQHF